MAQTRIDSGLKHWPQLAQAAGFEPQGWKARLLASRQDSRADRVVLALSHPDHPPLICKQALGAADIAASAAAIAAQRRAVTALAAQPGAGAPRILAALPDAGAILMEQVAGIQLADAVQDWGITAPDAESRAASRATNFASAQDTGPATAAIARAGSWTQAFHQSAPVEPRSFQPRFVAEHLGQAAQSVRNGQRRIARAGRFLACVERVLASASLAQSAPTRAAIRHGDLNARNLILSTSTQNVWGIDFQDNAIMPVGYDIARLLVALAECCPLAPGDKVVPAPIRRAFFASYRLSDESDRSIGFLCAARLLSNWLSLPERRHHMSLPQSLRFQRILALAEAGILGRS